MKRILLYKNSQHGGALILIMVMGALVASMAFYLLGMTQKVGEDISFKRRTEEYVRFNDYFRHQVIDGFKCTNAFWGKDISDAFTPAGQEMLDFQINMMGANQLLTQGWRSPFGNFLDRVLLIMDPADMKTGIMRDIPGSPLINARYGDLYLYTTRGTPPIHLPDHAHHRIRVMVYYSVVGGVETLYSCFSDYGDGSLCTLAGGTYNAWAPIGSRPRCEPDQKCFAGRVGLVTDPALCLAPYVATKVSQFLYTCNWCNQNY